MHLQSEVTEIDEAKGDKRDEDNKGVVKAAFAAGIKRGQCKAEENRTAETKRGKRYKGNTKADGADGSVRTAGSTDS